VLSKSTVPSFGEAYSAGVQNDHGFVAISAPVLETTLHRSSGDLKLVVGLFRRSVWQGSKSWNCALWNDVRDRRGSNTFVDPTAVLSKSTVPSFGEAYSAGEQNDHGFVAISAPVLETTLHWSSGDLKPVVGLFRRSVWQGSKSWNCALWNDVRDRRGSS
jgi:hypothetical protein